MTDFRKYLLLILMLGSLAWQACTQDRQPCLTPKIASLNVRSVRISSSTDTTAIDTALHAAAFVALTDGGLKGLIFPTQSTFTLSLSSIADSCQWSFITDTTRGVSLVDTITFRYKRDLQFVSNACGFAYFYNLLGVYSTNHIVDSLRITNTSVTNNVNTSHLQVYIHPNFL
jgi:hypothetical protein